MPLFGAMAICGTGIAVPVPLRLTVTAGATESLLGMSKLPLKVPAVVGAKRTVNVQVDAGVMVWPVQLSFGMLNGAAG